MTNELLIAAGGGMAPVVTAAVVVLANTLWLPVPTVVTTGAVCIMDTGASVTCGV